MTSSEQLINAVVSMAANLTWSDILNFKLIFLSIILEALPFILIGVLISAMINQFVPEQTIRRLFPKRNLCSIIVACFIGVFFPVCDCAIVPVARRLIVKGVPMPAALSFMLAAPIINPIVAAGTALAFNTQTVMWFRLIVALVVAIGVGLCINSCFRGNELKLQFNLQQHSHHCNCGQQRDSRSLTWYDRCINMLNDTCDEFFEMGRYLIFGAVLSAAAQACIPRAVMLDIGQNPGISIAAMMAFAFFISICSTADAFIAASFGGTFTLASLVAFMTFGPMIDLKNAFMLFHTFRLRLVIALIILTSVSCWGSAYLLHVILEVW